MKKLKAIIVLLFICAFANSQNSITGAFTGLANQHIKLVCFKGFDTYPIDNIQANEKGEYQLSFSKENYGMAYLLSEDNKSFVVILAEDENLQLAGENFALPETIVIKNGKQNKYAPKIC